MRFAIVAIILLFISTGCNQQSEANNSIERADTSITDDSAYISHDRSRYIHSHLSGNPYYDSIDGKPVSYYLNNRRCSPIAKNLYTGTLIPTDNDSTFALLDLATTDDSALRPFYVWCLNNILSRADGALSEVTGIYARRYAEKFPLELFELISYDTTSEQYKLWVGQITFGGDYESDLDMKRPQIARKMAATMQKTCKNCADSTKLYIDKFASDCFVNDPWAE